jgi:hypothetical protein
LLYNPGNTQDESRRLSWLKELKGVRAGFSNEMRMDGRGADGNLIKGASSGGDQHKVRGNFENSVNYVNRATLFSLANDFTKITPSPAEDSGLRERLDFFRFSMRFVDNPQASNERKKDSDIKRKFGTDEWKNALFYVIWRCWQDMSPIEKEVGGRLIAPDCVKAETVDWVTDGDGSMTSILEERYEITNDYNDIALSKEIVTFLTSKGLRMSPKKIGMEMRKLIRVSGWSDEQKGKLLEVRAGNKNVYHGMKLV